jgi:hypothetical protein
VKDTYLDVKADLDNNTTVIIEMEVLNVVPEIKKAFEIANQANLSQDELDD